MKTKAKSKQVTVLASIGLPCTVDSRTRRYLGIKVGDYIRISTPEDTERIIRQVNRMPLCRGCESRVHSEDQIIFVPVEDFKVLCLRPGDTVMVAKETEIEMEIP